MGDHCYSGSDMSNEDDTSTVPKLEQVDEASFSSIGSSPEPEVDVDVDVDGDGEPTLLDNAKVQKRKGGRKPVGIRGVISSTVELTILADLCDLGGTKAAKSASTGCIPRTPYGIYQATRDYHQASRRDGAKTTAEPSFRCRRVPDAAIQKLFA